MVIGCELCGSPANIYCESDRARLCWACDGKVHGVNFLVVKHSRTLLCHHCRAQTPWAASGPKLTPSTSFCLSCLSSQARQSSPSSGPINTQPQLADLDDVDVNVDVDVISFDYDDDHSQRFSDGDDDDEEDGVDDVDDDDEEDDVEEDGVDDVDDDDEEDDDEENQVVPWASIPPATNGGETEDYNGNCGLLKRKREIAFRHTSSGLVRF